MTDALNRRGMDLSCAEWRTSSYTGGNGSCVEVASNLPGIVAIRDSKRPEDGAHVVDRQAFGALLDQIRAGKLDI